MSSEDLAILEKLAKEHSDPAVRRAIRAALEELRPTTDAPSFLRRT